MSIMLKTFCYIILQITLLLSILFLLRGHNHPGGGFIASLIACTGIGFYSIAYLQPPQLIAQKQVLFICIGILCLVLSMLSALLVGKTLLTGLWLQFHLFGHPIKLGTPLLFDTGIYFSILGSLLWIITNIQRDHHD